jgi:hypothetical protein
VRPRSTRWLAAGIGTWLTLLAISAFTSGRLSLIDLMLLLGPLVVVPLARPLIAEVRFPPGAVLYGAALSLALAFLDPAVGVGGSVLAVPWLVVAVAVALRDGRRTLTPSSRPLVDLARLAACGFLVVGAFFAFATRAGWIVAGIHEPIIELTAVHFHFAGFATLVLATALARALPDRPRLANPTLTLACFAPPAVAVGFTWQLAPFQIGGAIMITLATWSLAAATVAVIVPRATTTVGRALLVVSSFAVLAPMVLAVFWAAAQYYDLPSLSIADMARVHGTVNAFGFVICGLAGWRLYSDV